MNSATPDSGGNWFSRTFATLFIYRDYRLMWMGSWTEHMGQWMETTALLWLMNTMTDSPFMGTLMVTLQYLPMIVFAFFGGILADRVNRRTMLVCALSVNTLVSFTLAALIYFNMVQPWHLLTYSALMGIITSFNHPARNTLIPNLVKKEHFLNAITLDNASVTASRIVGAPLAGVIMGFAGAVPVLLIRAFGTLIAIFWLMLIRAPETPAEAKKQSPWQNFKEGMSYIGQHKEVLSQVLLYLLPYFVTNSYTGVLPYFASNVLHVGPDLYGIMNAAPGAGSLIATVWLASAAGSFRQERMLLYGGIAQGLGMVLFSFSSVYFVSVLLLAFIGGANTTFMTLNNTLIQEMVTDKVRGRVMSLREVSNGIGPAGSLFTGELATLVGVSFALGAAGGIAIAALLIILLFVRQKKTEAVKVKETQ